MMIASSFLPATGAGPTPAIGLGVFDLAPDATADIVCAAIETGYRLIDTAAAYGNEAGVGEGIRRSGIDRDELLITTKLWIDSMSEEAAVRACRQSLDRLGLDRLDLYLIHWPNSVENSYLDAWSGMERIAEEGLSRRIGVSNFSTSQIDEILALGGTVPAVNQIEVHPFNTRKSRVADHTRRGIGTQAWSPLARGRVFREPLIRRLAELYGVSAARIVLRWQVQNGLVALAKASHPDRLAENLAVHDFVLGAEHMRMIDELDRGEEIEPDYYRLS